jgi:hypothetical protein
MRPVFASLISNPLACSLLLHDDSSRSDSVTVADISNRLPAEACSRCRDRAGSIRAFAPDTCVNHLPSSVWPMLVRALRHAASGPVLNAIVWATRPRSCCIGKRHLRVDDQIARSAEANTPVRPNRMSHKCAAPGRPPDYSTIILTINWLLLTCEKRCCLGEQEN